MTFREVLVGFMKSLQPAITVLLLVCLLMPGHIVGAVLCIRADGHITFEAAENGHCGSLSAVAFEHLPEQIADFSSSTDHHDPCIDVPFFARADAEARSRVFTLSALLKL
jgi:hypothetical protein